MDAIPNRPHGLFESGPRTTVRRTVLRLLRRLAGPEETERVVRAVLPQVRTMIAKLTLLYLVGQDPDAGHALVSPDASADLETLLRAEIRDASPKALAVEPEIFIVLAWAQR